MTGLEIVQILNALATLASNANLNLGGVSDALIAMRADGRTMPSDAEIAQIVGLDDAARMRLVTGIALAS